MDFHYSKPFGSYRLVTCLSKQKIKFSNDENSRNEIKHIKWDNGTSNHYHMCPVYYRCRFRAYEDVKEFHEKYDWELIINKLKLTYTRRFSKEYGRNRAVEKHIGKLLVSSMKSNSLF
jgi:hypothetical protein